MAIGDNIKGDILASAKAEVEHLFWVDKETGWSFYREGKLPGGTITIRDLNELISVLTKDV